MSWRSALRSHPERRLFANVAALSAIQVCRKAVPLLTLPYLARVLGFEGWGLLTFFQSYGACAIVAIEFGFSLSASRDIAQSRNDKEKLAEVTSAVLGAQLWLSALVVAATLALGFWIKPLHAHPAFTIAALLWALTEGCSPFWYFLGVEEMKPIAVLEISTKLLASAGVFLLVRRPEDGPLVLALQAGASGLALAIGLGLIRRRRPFAAFQWSSVARALKVGWPMFAIRSAESLYTVGNAFLLGVLASPSVVGCFAGPEKISRALFGLFNPLRDALYPRLSSLTRQSPVQAARLARIGTALTAAGGLLIAAGVFAFAPLLIRLAMGPGFGPAVPVLRVLAVLPILRAVSQSASLQWLLPRGKEATVIRIILFAAVAHVGMVMLVARRYTYNGMAWVVLASESLVCVLSVAAAVKASPPKAAPGAGTAEPFHEAPAASEVLA
jgi:PST family polysaccharide transporter